MMKKIIVLSLLILITLSGFSQGNSLTIFSEDGHQFYLILNGVRQNENPETNVQMNELSSDYYGAKIIFNDQTIPDIDRKILMVSNEDCKPCAVTYKIKTNKKGEVVMRAFAFSDIFTPPPAHVTVVQYNTIPMPAPLFGMQVNVNETSTTTTTTTTNQTTDNVNVDMNVGGFGLDVNVNVNDGWNEGEVTSTTTTTTTTTAPANVIVDPGCNTMSDAGLQTLISSINNKNFDDEKLIIAKQASSANCLTAMQIKKVMNVLEWEDSKLELAIHAHPYCLDPNNYWQVNDAFEWDDSVEKLNKSIGQ